MDRTSVGTKPLAEREPGASLRRSALWELRRSPGDSKLSGLSWGSPTAAACTGPAESLRGNLAVQLIARTDESSRHSDRRVPGGPLKHRALRRGARAKAPDTAGRGDRGAFRPRSSATSLYRFSLARRESEDSDLGLASAPGGAGEPTGGRSPSRARSGVGQMEPARIIRLSRFVGCGQPSSRILRAPD